MVGYALMPKKKEKKKKASNFSVILKLSINEVP